MDGKHPYQATEHTSKGYQQPEEGGWGATARESESVTVASILSKVLFLVKWQVLGKAALHKQ